MMTVLIVEDNAEMRRLLKSIVRDLVEAAYECSDGAEALAAYSAHHLDGVDGADGPDWVLMDIEMKTMDGITATQQILAAHPAAKVIIVTNHDHAEWRAAAQAAGACGYVLKENLFELRGLLQPGAAG
jgi:CheY-like chemotaxis protein